MPQTQDIVGLILAGGRSRRFGGVDKAFVELAGKPLITHVIQALLTQVGEILISTNNQDARYPALGYGLIKDRLPGFLGPLAGVHAGMMARPRQYLFTVSVDTPFISEDIVQRLMQGITSQRCHYPVMANGHTLALACAPGMANTISEHLEQDQRSVKAWLEDHGNGITLDEQTVNGLLRNINTPEDLVQAESWLQQH